MAGVPRKEIRKNKLVRKKDVDVQGLKPFSPIQANSELIEKQIWEKRKKQRVGL